MKVYTVFGGTGEYSDRTEWAIISFLSEEKAQERVLLATNKAKEWEASRNGYSSPPKGWNEYDPYMRMDYTGSDYWYETTDLVG